MVGLGVYRPSCGCYAGVVTWAVAQHYALKGYNRGSPPLQTATAPAQTQTLETPINNSPIFAPVFAPEFNQSQSQTQKQTVVNKNDIVPPEVECTDCYFAKAKLSGWNRLTEDDLSGSACMAAQADFHLRPIPGSNPWIELRSQFEFYNSDGDRLKRVRDGVWREQGNWIQMPFNGGDTRTLVVALVSSEGFMTYEYSEHQSNRPRFTTTGIFHSFLAPKSEPLAGSELMVRVRLIGKHMEEVKLNQDFWFSLSRPALTIEQVEPPRSSEE